MASNPSTFPAIGVEAMSGGYLAAGSGGIMSADVPHFHPGMLLDHGGFGFAGLGDAADLGAAHYAANNALLASFATQLFAAAPAPPPEETGEAYGVADGDSCVPASVRFPGHSGAMAVWSPPPSKKTYGSWTGAGGGPSAVSAHEPYRPHHAGHPDAGGLQYLTVTGACGGAGASAASELSLTLRANSSSDSALNAAEQSSSGASRSALTELYPRARSLPAPHFAVVVAPSRYAAVAQEVLNDVVGHMLDGVAGVSTDSCGGPRPSSGSAGAPSAVSSNRLMASSDDGDDAGARWGEAQRVRRSDLLKMLQLMDQKYNQCLDEIQSTTAKFNTLMHSGAGVGNGSICAPFAHRAVSAVYRGLRQRITGEIMAAAGRATCWGESSSSVTAGGDMERSWESAFIQKHWAAQQVRRGEQQCWRPQRGLPEKSVAVLKAWMFENFLHPYPKDHEKDVLAARSGLTRNQVSNWFINARVRLWKPMIEEMYQDLKRSSVPGGGQGQAMQQHVSKRRICELEGGQ
ncbi:hypothetical protein BS78_04G092700 [Paspalum vaginatum]|nr:hypothetical protein BS78_04G092700 [Paspalum vaginatum]